MNHFSLILQESIDIVYYIYKEQYAELNLQNETYDQYMKSSLATYLNNKGELYNIVFKDILIGNFFLYSFSEYTGIGSFLIYKKYRNNGYGSKVLSLINDSLYHKNKPYLLSCVKERIPFYEKNNFHCLQKTEVDFLYWMTNKEIYIKDEVLNESGLF